MYKNFNFWFPATIEKSIDPTSGKEEMKFAGIASTSEKDTDEESLDPKGFDINPLLRNGFVNWHHQSKTSPSAIIGEPTFAEIRKEGLWIETKLYDTQTSREVYSLAKALENSGSNRRLGFSIEGKVLKRKSDDPKSPDFKIIEKASITGVAITHQPKNPKTFAEIIKGGISEDVEVDDEIEKEEGGVENQTSGGLNTKNSKAIIKESLNKKLKNVISKNDCIEIIKKSIEGEENVENIYKLIKSIANMANRKKITEDDIQKAFSALGIENEVEGVDSKVEKSEKEDVSDDDEKTPQGVESEEVGKEKEEETEEENEVEEDESEKSFESELISIDEDLIQKAIDSSMEDVKGMIRATAILIKGTSQQLEKAESIQNDLLEIIKGQEETIAILSEKIEEYGSFTPAPKSVRSMPMKRNFEKSDDDELSGESKKSTGGVKITDKKVVAEILDAAAFNKGYDEEFSKACTSFEASGQISQNIISRLKTEYGIEIIK